MFERGLRLHDGAVMKTKLPVTDCPDRVNSIEDFQTHWSGLHNFLIDSPVFSPRPKLPPIAAIVDRVRKDKDARILRNQCAKAVNLQSVADWFRSLAIEEAMTEPFNLAHFDIERFDQPGDILEGFRESFLDPWKEFLRSAGFTWTRLKPYFFISGRASLTPYHMDLSHVLALQCYGSKRFSALRDPERYASAAVRKEFVLRKANYPEWFHMPEDLQPQEIRPYDMVPGDLLWNVFLTPHWVESLKDEPALSINISHGGLKFLGEYCPHETEARQWGSLFE